MNRLYHYSRNFSFNKPTLRGDCVNRRNLSATKKEVAAIEMISSCGYIQISERVVHHQFLTEMTNNSQQIKTEKLTHSLLTRQNQIPRFVIQPAVV